MFYSRWLICKWFKRFKDEAARWHEEHRTVGQDVGFMCSDKYFVIYIFFLFVINYTATLIST